MALYQPQVDSYTEDLIEGRAAVSVTKGAGEPIFGAVWISARLATDRDTRNVDILTVEVPTVRFPEATDEEQSQLAALLEREAVMSNVAMMLGEIDQARYRSYVVLRAEAEGTVGDGRGRRIIEIVDHEDADTGLTAMMRMTGFPAAILSVTARASERADSGSG